jgi:ribosomal protein S18 acetylase RimI-like enzyme
LLLLAGVAVVVNVTTLPEARRQGIGRAMTQVALEHAGELGYAVAILGTSASARGIYARMGFAHVGTSRGYVLERT